MNAQPKTATLMPDDGQIVGNPSCLRPAIYLRAGHPQEDVTHQRRAVTEFAAAQGWRLVAEVSDHGHSRVGFASAMVAAERGDLNVLVVAGPDRLGWRLAEVDDILRRLDNAGVALACANGATSTVTPAQRLSWESC